MVMLVFLHYHWKKQVSLITSKQNYIPCPVTLTVNIKAQFLYPVYAKIISLFAEQFSSFDLMPRLSLLTFHCWSKSQNILFLLKFTKVLSVLFLSPECKVHRSNNYVRFTRIWKIHQYYQQAFSKY